MLRPLAIGIPIVLVVVIAFVVGMNTVPFDSPYFKYVIIGYVVLFPGALLYTIIGTIRGARRLMAGGDVSLRERGKKTMATVTEARTLNMTMRVGGGYRHHMHAVRLKTDHGARVIKTTTATLMQGAPEAGDRVPVYLDPENAKNFFVDWAQSSGAQRLPGGVQIDQIVSQIKGAAGGATQVHVMGTGQDWGQASGGQGRAGGVQLEQILSQIKAAAAAGTARVNVIGAGEHADAARAAALSGQDAHAGTGHASLEGRARIEGLKPYPDGTYDLDLYVTPRGRSSYRVAARVPVPAGTGLLERGQTLKVRIDPDIASRVDVVWD